MAAKDSRFGFWSHGATPPWLRSAAAASVSLLLISACGGADQGATTTASSLPAATTTTDVSPSTTSRERGTTSTAMATTTTTLEEGAIEIRVEGGSVADGPGEVVVELGSEVRLVVRSDTADHVHVHGYDLFSDVGPGEEAEIRFVADVPGVFEVELEDSGLLLLQIEVS